MGLTLNDTDSIKINRPVYNMRMFWTNFWQPTVHIQQTIFEKTPIEVFYSYLYASFGTFCVQIGQFFKAQWVFEACFRKSTNCCYRRKMSPMFKDSLCSDSNNRPIWKQNMPKEAQRCRVFFKNILIYMNGRLSKDRSLHTHVIPPMVYINWICTILLILSFILARRAPVSSARIF